MAKAQQLKDLDVERVDGVDKPATGRPFLLFKSEDAPADQIMKGYAMTATAADAFLKAIRTDKNAVMSVKSAIAVNGLAQVLGQGAVFLSKSVPTQPYEFSEPDADKRGPADEKLGPNFTPRAMPGSMVGAVQFSLTAEAQKAVKEEEPEPEEDEENGKDMPPWMKSLTGTLAGMTKAIEGQTTLLKSIADMEQAGISKIQKAEVEKIVAPRSKQVDKDEKPVRKDEEGRVSFADVVFGQK